jgi:hypothetical protein
MLTPFGFDPAFESAGTFRRSNSTRQCADLTLAGNDEVEGGLLERDGDVLRELDVRPEQIGLLRGASGVLVGALQREAAREGGAEYAGVNLHGQLGLGFGSHAGPRDSPHLEIADSMRLPYILCVYLCALAAQMDCCCL